MKIDFLAEPYFIADLKCFTCYNIISKYYFEYSNYLLWQRSIYLKQQQYFSHYYIRKYILSSDIFMLPKCALNFLQTSRQCQGCCTLYHVTRKTGANNNILHGLDFTFLGDLWRSRNLYQLCLDISIYWGRQTSRLLLMILIDLR